MLGETKIHIAVECPYCHKTEELDITTGEKGFVWCLNCEADFVVDAKPYTRYAVTTYKLSIGRMTEEDDIGV